MDGRVSSGPSQVLVIVFWAVSGHASELVGGVADGLGWRLVR
jgi:hypothetical protein